MDSAQILLAQLIGTVQECSIWLTESRYLLHFLLPDTFTSCPPAPPVMPLLFSKDLTCTFVSLSCSYVHLPWNLVSPRCSFCEPPKITLKKEEPSTTHLPSSLALGTQPDQWQRWVYWATVVNSVSQHLLETWERSAVADAQRCSLGCLDNPGLLHSEEQYLKSIPVST